MTDTIFASPIISMLAKFCFGFIVGTNILLGLGMLVVYFMAPGYRDADY